MAFSDAGKTLTLTLRAGVKFSDGSAMTAGDVKWSLDRARDPKAGAWNDLIASIDAVTVAGPDSVVLKLKTPDPTILAALATFNTGIMPQKLFEAAAGATKDDKAKAFGEKPVGTGPFMMVEWKRNQVMRLVRNPHYWRQGEDGHALPYLDELEFQIIPDDSTRILKLKAGELHGSEFIPLARVKELQGDKNLRMELWPSTAVSYVVPTYSFTGSVSGSYDGAWSSDVIALDQSFIDTRTPAPLPEPGPVGEDNSGSGGSSGGNPGASEPPVSVSAPTPTR